MNKFDYKNKLEITALKANISDFTQKRHFHEEFSLGVTLNNTQLNSIADSSNLIDKNAVMLFNPNEVHECTLGKYKDGVDYVMLYLKPELIFEALEKKEIFRFDSPIIYNEKIKNDILSLSSAILNQKEESVCSELYLNLVDNFRAEDLISKYKNENEFIKKAKEIIYYELDDVLDLEQISKELNLSRFQFIRLFKSNTGITPYQYFLNMKLIHAKKHLDKTKDLYETLVEYGFSDLSHFNRHFKKTFGITAYEYISK
ncbi:AraC family transcriptional regulator [Arcobacter sp. CECT 8986]|uniref:AraC family transcriptional regulator n=1 Tax=Arcobacter sp. CECT 8986 TaxID=2044507 RepID=UPI001009EF46|nr:AraC family transcriptional regulator [Arcobacter sp. CECT 8986]RXK01217.1 AraC family transcriptional regulator [Arcobacter sp. CECT 8986]